MFNYEGNTTFRDLPIYKNIHIRMVIKNDYIIPIVHCFVKFLAYLTLKKTLTLYSQIQYNSIAISIIIVFSII